MMLENDIKFWKKVTQFLGLRIFLWTSLLTRTSHIKWFVYWLIYWLFPLQQIHRYNFFIFQNFPFAVMFMSL